MSKRIKTFQQPGTSNGDKADHLKPGRHPKSRIYKISIIAGVVVLVFIISIFSNIIGRSFTSDDVSEQSYTHNLTQPGPHTILMENDTYILKLPVYFVFNAIVHPGRTQLVLESLLFNGLMIVLLLIWWRKIAPKTNDSWLVFIWLLTTGVYWISQTINSNDRNADIGLMLLFSLFAIRIISSPIALSRRTLLYTAGGSVIAAILTYDDPYFLFFVLIPLLTATYIYSYRQKVYSPAFVFTAGLLLCLLMYKALAMVFAHFGLLISNINRITVLTSTTVRQSYIPTKIVKTLNAYLSLMGSSPKSIIIHPSYWLLPSIIFNAGVVFLALNSLYDIIRHHKYTPLNLWVLMTIIVSFGYILIIGDNIIDTFRYFLILLPVTALLVASAIMRFATGPRKYYRLATAVVGIALCLNVINGVVLIYQKRNLAAPNLINYQIISALNKYGVTTSYGDYWVANISYYLSDYKDNVLPMHCSKGDLYPDPTLLDAQRYKIPHTTFGVIVAPSLFIATPETYHQAPSCTVKATIKQFGLPQKIVHITPAVSLLIYDHSPLSYLK